MKYEQWEEKYKPKANHFRRDEDTNLFETFGPELGYVMAVSDLQPKRVWTLVDGDVGTYIVSGYHLVNRIAYFITEEPFEGDFLEVLDSEYQEDEHEAK